MKKVHLFLKNFFIWPNSAWILYTDSAFWEPFQEGIESKSTQMDGNLWIWHGTIHKSGDPANGRWIVVNAFTQDIVAVTLIQTPSLGHKPLKYPFDINGLMLSVIYSRSVTPTEVPAYLCAILNIANNGKLVRIQNYVLWFQGGIRPVQWIYSWSTVCYYKRIQFRFSLVRIMRWAFLF